MGCSSSCNRSCQRSSSTEVNERVSKDAVKPVQNESFWGLRALWTMFQARFGLTLRLGGLPVGHTPRFDTLLIDYSARKILS